MNENQTREILVAPRSLFQDYRWFVPWDVIEPQLRDISSNATWVEREIAEQSYSDVQIIPCGIIKNSSGEYCVQRRVKSTRPDLNSKITLTFGGHIDRVEQPQGTDFLRLLLLTLSRELEEELGVQEINNFENVGVVIDPSSLLASRHVAFVFQALVDSEVSPLAREEFSVHSKYSASFLTAEKITGLLSLLDPWSRIVFEERLNPRSKPQGRQMSLIQNI